MVVQQTTIVGNTPEELDKQANELAKKFPKGKGSQMRAVVMEGTDGPKIVLVETIWYEVPDVGQQAFITPKVDGPIGPDLEVKKDWKQCASCNLFVLVSKYKSCKCGSTEFKEIPAKVPESTGVMEEFVK